MRRHLPRLLLTGALLSPMSLYALGLGEIRLNSALNQPFDAEIELLSPTPEELGSLKVTLASNDVFSRYGIDRPAYLSNFDFSVSRGRDGKATIKVTSNRSVTEPYVTLLVEASWARGRLVREYTVLLDPPVFMPSQNEAPAAPVTTPQSATTAEGRIERRPTTPAPEPTPAPPRATTPAPEPTPAPSQAQREEPTDQIIASPGSEYVVQRNDTLSKIAAGVNPGPRRVNNQTMIALFRANPQAFSGNNINRLRAGSVLRIPELSVIEAIPSDEAGAEVARQTAEWSGGVVADTTPESDRLRLVTPQETPTPPTAAPAPEQQAQQQPSTSPGAPSAPDRRLEVENPALAQAQQNVEPTPAQPVEEAPTEEVLPNDAQSQAEEPVASEETVTPAAEEPAPTPRATPAPVPEPTLVERLKDYWWALVALGLLLVVGLAFLRRRREAEDDSLDALSMPMDFDPPSERPARALAPSSKGGRADAFLVEGEDDAGLVKTNLDEALDFDAPDTKRREPVRGFEPAAAAAAPAARGLDDTMSSDSAVRFDQQDALAEADFHMAYGLYDQAADLVKIAIDREPSRRDLKLKLLEIYFVWGNKDLFLDTARDLYDTRDDAAPGEWDKVLIMGKQIAPDDTMFKGEGGPVDLVDVNLEGGENRVDVDLFAEPGQDRQGLDLEFASGERRAPSATDATQVSSDLDFLLDEPNDDDTQEQRTREVDQLARTQETPTIESPMIDRSVQTVREKIDAAAFKTGSTGDTAELSIDDLGLDANALDQGEALEDTTSIEKDLGDDMRPLRDDEMTQLAPSLSSFDRTMEAPRVSRFDGDIESTGTIYIDQVDLAAAAGDTAEHPRPDVDSTASMGKPLAMTDIDLDLDNLSSAQVSSDTVRRPREADDVFSSDVFGEPTQDVTRGGIDLDVGDPLSSSEDNEPTQRQSLTTEMELSELEPVTMSEVGTKLDLARAYMDMGDPDGARSILDEVLGEGNPSQKQEAQRLMDSIR
ncbi:LysM peptidoglycan-binding domain-containing protein [Steroidobacter sp. S1-65]|uniref:LysM peptidoglycan-binding domain-containing protein n=1 Tax=Steroidobacter gossypii TaxID=2805490 RepID=A0ABS1X1B9_9GAMM|nr:FimV/HubP family polar landmark protein [Steroidobacter gossypii]MBM0107008.1 LysM peptidoglycan-binding domain-containing protein [Steroidobacter gossypii]